MLSLHDYELPEPFDYSHKPLTDITLVGFPDPNNRSAYEPLVILSVDQVLDYAQQLAGYLELTTPITAYHHIKPRHLFLIRDYARSIGWGRVLMSGKQVVLEHYEGTQTSISPEHPRKEHRTLVADYDSGAGFNLRETFRTILGSEDDRYMTIPVTGIRYLGPVDDLLPYPQDITNRLSNPPRGADYHDETNNIAMMFLFETGNSKIVCERKVTCRFEIEFYDFSLEFIGKQLANNRV